MRTRGLLPGLALAAAAVVFAAEHSPREALFYSDLGPETIDVSAYPAAQRENYAVYSRACSRCHTLARSINAPYASRGWWEFYMTNMRLRGSIAQKPFSKEEVKAVLEFLEYDSRLRKVERSAEFEASTRELRRRFDRLVDERMRALQTSPAAIDAVRRCWTFRCDVLRRHRDPRARAPRGQQSPS